jgi:large subunit ribosomal protein L25
MAKTSATKLDARPRTSEGSRAARRLRREGRIPGVLYGGGEDPVAFDVDARELRHALAATGAVLDVNLDGASSAAVVKHTDHHPVRGETIHLDLIRVNLNVAIQATVALELTGVDDAPGVVAGGVLDQVTREVTIEALPTEIPESLVHDVSGMEMNDTLFLTSVSAPAGVTIVGDAEHLAELVVATLAPPRLEIETDEEIETETERVGEGQAGAEGEAAQGDGAEAAAEGGGDSDESTSE